MNSLADSSMEEIKQAIRSVPWLESYYDIGENYIRTRNKRVFYLFCGLRQNLESLKSKARILLCWIDEAETVSEMAYRKLLPTVREQVHLPNGDIYMSEIWVTWNPEKRDSPTSVRFRHEKILDADGVQIGVGSEMNYMDNPWFPEVLEIERKRDQKNLEDAVYRWIWEGAYLEQSEAQVFKNKYIIEKFEADPKTWDGAYIGLDFGFAQDPTACVKCWIHEDRIYIEYEAGGVGMELDDTVPILEKKIPDIAKYPVYADNARPESISHLRKKGLRRIVGVEKGKGSVEDGIAFIKSFDKVVIHPRCTNTIQEFRDYSYKKDRLTDEILPVIVDKDNHYIDACIEHGQLVSTIKGDIPVQDIRSGDMVLTRKGYKRVNHAWKTYDNAKIWVVKTFNGLELRATENHLIYTSNGFARVDALSYNDEILTSFNERNSCEIQKKLSMMESLGLDTQILKEEVTGSILKNLNQKEIPSIFTDIFGSNTMEKSQKATMFIILMRIVKTMTYQTLPLCMGQNTDLCMPKNGLKITKSINSNTWTTLGIYPKIGTQAKRDEPSTEKSGRKRTKTLSQQIRNANNVQRYLPRKRLVIEMNFAQILANLSIDDLAELMTLSLSVNTALLYSLQTSTKSPKLVEDRVLTVYATEETNKVYDLEVEGEHEFFASNILVHNCRYALEKIMKQRRAMKISRKAIGAFSR